MFKTKVKIYTDGACSPNPGVGGWGAILISSKHKIRTEISGAEGDSTNNRMEMLAAIEGLRAVTGSSTVTVHTDSTYLINTMTKGWKRKANQDLWTALDREVNERHVDWKWVRGHSGDPLNEEADSVAFEESQARAGRKTKIKPRQLSYDRDQPQKDKAKSLTHVDQSGRAYMVDVGGKTPTRRVAVAEGRVVTTPETIRLIKENAIKKGDVLSVARVAGVMAAKRSSELIPLCHPLPLDLVTVELTIDENDSSIQIEAKASTTSTTGVEMEAFTAVTVAALTVYDMCKAVDRSMRIEHVRLLSKSGGKSDFIADC